MNNMKKNPVVLAILDGFGISYEKKGNAITLAKTPNLEYISGNYPGTTLRASGVEVGLSWGEQGSSEVGHANLGAGMVVYQNLEKINQAIKDKSFFALPIWKKAVDFADKNKSVIHLMGLVSNGGVHSHIDHVFAILEKIKSLKFKGEVLIHVFPDGQDVAEQSASKFTEMLERGIEKIGISKVATVIGRYFAMDKNENWDRAKKAYDCLTQGRGNIAKNAKEAIENSYKKGIKDEYIEPTVIVDDKNKPIGLIEDGDAVISFNFRADRIRQLTRAFVSKDFKEFPVNKFKNLFYIPMTQYGMDFALEPAFPLQNIKNPLAKVISDASKTQFHIAEKEKYAHVTYFFNGGREKTFIGEAREIMPSKKVATYDLAPEMNAREITNRVISEIKKDFYDFYVVNYANGDLVGHTGNLKAAIKAVETLDDCIGKILNETLRQGGTLIITADHGNVEEMINLETEEMDKEHSTNPVPLWIARPAGKKAAPKGIEAPQQAGGILADVAPTVLEIMGIKTPKEMTGTSLLNVISYCVLPK